jgi:hypothetical protein
MLYAIDDDDRLVEFDSAFRSFAIAGGAPQLPEQWLGRSLWEATASSEINMVFRSLVGRARLGQAVSVPTRCDAPPLERHVKIDIALRDDGLLTFTSRVTRARFTLGAAAQHPPRQVHDRLRMCAWCFRIEEHDGWYGAEHVVAEHGLLMGGPIPDVTHGICPDCLGPQLDEADSWSLPSPLLRSIAPS